MEQSTILIDRKNDYVNCLNQLVGVANSLVLAINEMSRIIQYQDAYKLDDKSAKKIEIESVYEKERKIYNQIVNQIIPGTRAIIENLQEQITEALSQEQAV